MKSLYKHKKAFLVFILFNLLFKMFNKIKMATYIETQAAIEVSLIFNFETEKTD